MKKEIKVYKTKDGKEPFTEWLNVFRKKDQDTYFRILKRLKFIKETSHIGNNTAIREGVRELRFFFGSGIRIYYAEINEQILLLLCGGDKGTQTRDIKKALAYWKEYNE